MVFKFFFQFHSSRRSSRAGKVGAGSSWAMMSAGQGPSTAAPQGPSTSEETVPTPASGPTLGSGKLNLINLDYFFLILLYHFHFFFLNQRMSKNFLSFCVIFILTAFCFQKS